MNCRDFREIADSYLSEELLIETNHQVLQHLENCAECRHELAARRELRERLRAAVKDAPAAQIRREFATKLQANLREQALRQTIGKRIWQSFRTQATVFATAAAACLIFVVALSVFWRRQTPPQNSSVVQTNSGNSAPDSAQNNAPQIETVVTQWEELTRQAVGDHVDCALGHRPDEAPISLAAAAERFGKYNQNLDKAVSEALRQGFGDKFKILSAHSCVLQGKRFAHVILQHKEHTVSVIVTDADPTDPRSAEEIMFQSSDAFRLATFRAAQQAVFVVSDLSETETSAMARTLFPALRNHIEQSAHRAA